MHEVHLMAQLVKMIEASLEATPGAAPLCVRLRISALSHLMQHDRDQLQAAYVLAAQGTRAAGAELEIQRMPVTGRCRACGHAMSVSDIVTVCSSCGSTTVDVEDVPELVLHEMVVTE